MMVAMVGVWVRSLSRYRIRSASLLKGGEKMICKICGQEDDNYPIWIQPAHFGDPPTCYCEKIDRKKKSPCGGHCYPSVTMYPCESCKKQEEADHD